MSKWKSKKELKQENAELKFLLVAINDYVNRNIDALDRMKNDSHVSKENLIEDMRSVMNVIRIVIDMHV